MALQLDGNSGIVYTNLNQDIKSLLLPKNWIINGMFDVWQRGISQTSAGYGSDDRWVNDHSGSTKTHSQQSFSIGQTDVPNNPKYFSRTVVTSLAGVGNLVFKTHRIEDVTKLAGKTITISFWAKADAPKNISIEFTQVFGSGGSAQVNTIGVQKFALTTSWQRFTKTISLPSVSGKTIGSDNFTQLNIWFDAGSNYNARTDSLGNQSGTFDIANISLVEGSVAVECQNQPYADVLRECQRYCKQLVDQDGGSYQTVGLGFSGSATQAYINVDMVVEMRATPTLELTGTFAFGDGAANATSITVESLFSSKRNVTLNATGSGMTTGRANRLHTNPKTGASLVLSADFRKE